MISTTFSSLHLKSAMLKNLASLGYAVMMRIQAGKLVKVRRIGSGCTS